MLMPNLNTPGDDPTYTVSPVGNLLGYETSFNQIMRSPNFWTNNPNSFWTDDPTGQNLRNVLRVERQLVRLLRHFVFRPGIPGFYAMRHDDRDILNNPVAPGAGANSLGDGLLDNDLDYLNQGPATYSGNYITATTTKHQPEPQHNGGRCTRRRRASDGLSGTYTPSGNRHD
jgi:hypothetical protein